MTTLKDSTQLELLVAKIQKTLAPEATITHDAKIVGSSSKRKRQIDVLVEQKVGQYNMRIAIDCKDYKKKVDVKGVEEFSGLLKDINAHRGALVCPKGFSSTAKRRAKDLSIDLYSPIDTDPHKWQVEAKAPSICDFREAKISFKFSFSAPLPLTLPNNFITELIVYDNDNNPLGTMYDVAFEKWNKGEYPSEPGIHSDMKIFEPNITLIDNGHNMRVPIDLRADIYVENKLFFGEMPIEKISGFKDEQNDLIITNAFSLKMLDPNDVEKNWQPIDNESDAPIKPLLKLIGLIGYLVP